MSAYYFFILIRSLYIVSMIFFSAKAVGVYECSLFLLGHVKDKIYYSETVSKFVIIPAGKTGEKKILLLTKYIRSKFKQATT